MTWRSVFSGTLAAFFALAASANAANITGTLGIGGGVFYDNLAAGTGLAIIDFDPTGGGEGEATVIKAATGYFSATAGLAPCLGGNTTCALDIYDLTNSAAAGGVAPAGPMFAPAGADLTAVPSHFGKNFLHDFNDPDADGLHFDLFQIVLQPGVPCTTGLETTCVLGPFVLTETAEGLRIAFDVLGWFRNDTDNDGDDDDEGFFKGAFSTTFLGITMEEARDRIALPGGPEDLLCQVDNDGDGDIDEEVTCTWDSNFAPAVIPEPATLLTFGAGSAALAAIRRRRAKRASTK
jgi:hypothetical protein